MLCKIWMPWSALELVFSISSVIMHQCYAFPRLSQYRCIPYIMWSSWWYLCYALTESAMLQIWSTLGKVNLIISKTWCCCLLFTENGRTYLEANHIIVCTCGIRRRRGTYLGERRNVLFKEQQRHFPNFLWPKRLGARHTNAGKYHQPKITKEKWIRIVSWAKPLIEEIQSRRKNFLTTSAGYSS